MITALDRIAHGLVDECRDTGRSTRYLASRTDALVVHALARAQMRREQLRGTVVRSEVRVMASLLPELPQAPPS